MIDIKRLAITLLALLALAIIVIVAGIYASNRPLNVSPDATDAASRIALSHPDVSGVIQRMNDSQYVPVIISSGPINTTAGKSFIRYPGNLTGIRLDIQKPSGSPPPTYHFYMIVDTERNLTVDKISWMDRSDDDEFFLPPGAAWYDRISYTADAHGTRVPHLDIEGRYTPENASVFQLIVDREGLDMLRNAPAEMPLQSLNVSDHSLNAGGRAPQGTGWTVKLNVGTGAGSNEAGKEDITTLIPDADEYYLVLINGEISRAINLTIHPGVWLYYA